MTCPLCQKKFEPRGADGPRPAGGRPPRGPVLVRCPHCGYEFRPEKTC